MAGIADALLGDDSKRHCVQPHDCITYDSFIDMARRFIEAFPSEMWHTWDKSIFPRS